MSDAGVSVRASCPCTLIPPVFTGTLSLSTFVYCCLGVGASHDLP
jgi:hypothetical protein